jgi:hypothetical protein
MMINRQNRLFHRVDKLIVVVTWAFEVHMVFVAASLVAFVEDMLQKERHNVSSIQLITTKLHGLKIKIDYYHYY